MFGILAALTSISTERNGRQALDYENYIRTGQGLPRTRIYRESSEEKRTRKELAQVRSQQRFVQQVKLVRLMKKLLQQIHAEKNDDNDDDEEEENDEMTKKVRQLELKIIRLAQQKNFNVEAMLDLEKPDDNDDCQLEQIVRQASIHMPDTERCDKETTGESFRNILPNSLMNNNDQSHGDYMHMQSDETKIESLSLTSSICDHGDNHLVERSKKKRIVSS